MRKTKRTPDSARYSLFMTACGLLLPALFIVSFYVGRYTGLSKTDVPGILLSQIFAGIPKSWSVAQEGVVLQLRLPRIVASAVIGASLAASGASYQLLFKNPIASADTLGVTSSASFGAVLAILLHFPTLGVKMVSFASGCAAVLTVYAVSHRISRGRNMTVFLILIGMIVSSVFSAMLSILKYVADPVDVLPKITYWLLGSVGNVQLSNLPYCIAFFLIGFIPLMMLRWRLNLLSLSDSEAKSVGENINLLRVVTIICATMLTSSAVAMTGGISWVGLVIPHIARLIVGNDSRKLLPASAVSGALFLLLMDDLARSMTVYELPISIMTSLIGAPLFFVSVLVSRRQLEDGY